MNKYFEILRDCPLFDGIDDKDLTPMLGCLGAKESSYYKGEIILAEGSPAKYVGIVLAGKVQVERFDYYGNRSILASIEPAGIFGESFACAGLEALPVHAMATENTVVLLLVARRIMQPCSHVCAFHCRMIFNLLQIVARKNLVFHQKIELTSRRTTREKLMAYLLLEAKKSRSNPFTISFDRQALADYLEVDRSGLSAEIAKLRKEKIIECRRNQFTLLRPPAAE